MLLDKFNDWGGVIKAMDVSNSWLSDQNDFATQCLISICNHFGVLIPRHDLIGIAVNMQQGHLRCRQRLE